MSYLEKQVTFLMSHRFFSDDSAILAEYESGVSSGDIARKYGTTRGIVLNTIKRAGGKIRSLSESRKIYSLTHESNFKGHKHSEETRRLMSAHHADYRGEKHPRYGHKDIVGDKNPNWRVGIGSKTDLGRNTFQDLAWKKTILESDLYTCQMCGSTNKRNLVTHHIEGWVQNPELRHESNNGICLCRPCHASIHARGYENYMPLFKEKVKLREL